PSAPESSARALVSRRASGNRSWAERRSDDNPLTFAQHFSERTAKIRMDATSVNVASACSFCTKPGLGRNSTLVGVCFGREATVMSTETATTGALRRAAAALCAVTLLATAPVSPALTAVPKASKSAASEKSETTPEKIQELMTLLADPKVRDWLEKESKAEAAQARGSDAEETSVSRYFDKRIGATREHIIGLATALPDLPNQFGQAEAKISTDLGDRGRIKILLHLVLFVALGFGVEWLFRKATQRVRERLDAHPLETVNDRLRVVAARFAFAIGLVAAFAIGSIGPFLALDWAPLFREMLLGYLVAFLVIRIAAVVGHLLLSPGHERFRIVPMETRAARFWCRRITLFVGWFAIGWVLVGLTPTLGW